MVERVSRLEEKVSCMDARLELVEQDLRALGKKNGRALLLDAKCHGGYCCVAGERF